MVKTIMPEPNAIDSPRINSWAVNAMKMVFVLSLFVFILPVSAQDHPVKIGLSFEPGIRFINSQENLKNQTVFDSGLSLELHESENPFFALMIGWSGYQVSYNDMTNENLKSLAVNALKIGLRGIVPLTDRLNLRTITGGSFISIDKLNDDSVGFYAGLGTEIKISSRFSLFTEMQFEQVNYKSETVKIQPGGLKVISGLIVYFSNE